MLSDPGLAESFFLVPVDNTNHTAAHSSWTSFRDVPRFGTLLRLVSPLTMEGIEGREADGGALFNQTFAARAE